MARGEDVFAKVEPAFFLGRTEAGRAFRALSKSTRLAYMGLWMTAVDQRSATFSLDPATEKQLMLACDLSRPQYLRDCIEELSRLHLVRIECVSGAQPVRSQMQPCAQEVTQQMQFTVLHVREKHSGYKFRTSPNGESAPPELSQRREERVKSNNSSSKEDITTGITAAEPTAAPVEISQAVEQAFVAAGWLTVPGVVATWQFPERWILEAVACAYERKGRSPPVSYIQGILQRYQGQGGSDSERVGSGVGGGGAGGAAGARPRVITAECAGKFAGRD